MTFLENIKRWIKIGFVSLFYGMRAGDNEIFKSEAIGSRSEITKHDNKGGIFSDLLENQETQRVKETRDSYYRVLNEADKYHVDVFGIDKNGEFVDDTISGVARKKTFADFSAHCNIFEDEHELILIQDNFKICNSVQESLSKIYDNNPFDYKTILILDWKDITPRFQINKFITKIIVKKYSDTESIIEFYCPTIAGQFTKLDAIFIKELNNLFSNKYEYSTDIKNLYGCEFITEKAWNCDNLCLYQFNEMRFEDIFVYDGHFVLKYIGKNVEMGKSVTEKYRTKELDEKYNNNAPKKDATDVFTIDRHINGINFGEGTIK